jgi:DNA adenine methylase
MAIASPLPGGEGLVRLRDSPDRSFIRWAGGKTWLRRYLPSLLPNSFGTYFEPFLGSGATFFCIRPCQAFLSDVNEDLVNAFRIVRDYPNELIRVLEGFENNEREYYQIRESRPRSALSRAARFVYLNRTAWNGLYRLNGSGRFNVPYGEYESRKVADPDRLLAASRSLRGATVSRSDFLTPISRAEEGDFVFVDPPYATPALRSTFTSYTARKFGWLDQLRLFQALVELDRRGGTFLLTNSDHPALRALYRQFRVESLTRSSVISGDPIGRGPMLELVITNYDHGSLAG